MVNYFPDWNGNAKKETLNRLKGIYENADQLFDDRFKDNKASQNEAFFKNLLQDIDKMAASQKNDDLRKNDELRKMFCLARGNVLLRMGQDQGENFQGPLGCYQRAGAVLEQEYEPDEKDCLNLMIQLNLGKYFQCLGQHNQRSDYLRALDEFEAVQEKIEKKEIFSPQETRIWLEATVNIGWMERYLYRLQAAKVCFLDVVGMLLGMQESPYIQIPGLDQYLRGHQKPEIRKKLRGDSALYEKYLLHALVQLSIAYQKSRDYGIAQEISAAVLRIQRNNVDAANNLAICLRKQRIEKSLLEKLVSDLEDAGMEKDKAYAKVRRYLNVPESKNAAEDPIYVDMSYTEIFAVLKGKGNRFAILQKIKCDMYDESSSAKTLRKIEKEIGTRLKKNPADQEVRLLQGIYLAKFRKIENAREVLHALYKQYPHMAKGSLGLKAYYNVAGTLLYLRNFYEAKKYFEKIIKECKKDDSRKDDKRPERENNELSETEKEICLQKLPQGDLLAEIDLGWCLMNLGDYKGAKKCYFEILKKYRDMPDRLGQSNEMKIKNNLAECCLHMADGCGQAQTVVPDSGENRETLLEEARRNLDEVLEKEPKNAVAYRHYGYYYKLLSQNDPKYLEESLNHFDLAETSQTDDILAHSGWVSAAVPLLIENRAEMEGEKREKLIRRVENKLKYSSGTYSIKACAKLASFVLLLEEDYRKKVYAEEKLKTMYRSLARIRLGQDEEGYGLFRHLLENDTFRGLEAVKRGELLTALYRLYEQTTRIKEICRFQPDVKKSDEDFSLPVHYTKINTLKKLLPIDLEQTGRLRLWNTVYMNDSFEGECFIDMMRQARKKRLKQEKWLQKKNETKQDEKVKKEMEKEADNETKKRLAWYFPHLDEYGQDKDLLNPVNENVYVSSFSQNKNAIHMWIPYGDNAKGCAVVFADEFFDIRKTKDTLTDVSTYSGQEYPLYKIQYLDEKKWREWKKNKESIWESTDVENDKIGIILEIMEGIWDILDDLECRMRAKGALGLEWKTLDREQKNNEGQEETKMIRSFVSDCLNEVRFLIKSAEYQYEDEVRMQYCSYEPEIQMEGFDVPRLYVEVDRDIRIREVKLGPKIDEPQVNEIVSWLTKTKKVERITRSGRHYK